MDNLSSVFARNCLVRRIGKAESAAFMDANHRLGATGCLPMPAAGGRGSVQ